MNAPRPDATHTYDRRSGRTRAQVALEGATKQAVETGHARLLAVAAVFVLCFLVLGGRLVHLTVLRDGPGAGAIAQAVSAADSYRADIVDRNGLLLATNVRTASLYAEPRIMMNQDEAVAKLATVFPEIDKKDLLVRLHSDKSFTWVRRHLTPKQQAAVNALGIPGIGFLDETRRIYPQGRAAAHVLGYVGIDNEGLAGVEKAFDAQLRGPDAARSKRPLQLSIDIRVQHILRDELARAVTNFRAIGGAGIIYDVHSGEVIAMASMPDFDSNAPGEATAEQLFNRVTLGVYEMGSTFKAFTIASALHYGTSGLDDTFDATEPIRVGRYQIRDDHAKSRWLTVPEIFMYSSNIGAAKIAMEVGTERQRLFLQRLGLLSRPDIELPEVGAPMVPTPWREINTMTIAFGHGIAVSPLQTAAGFAPLINGGVRVPSTLIKRPQGEVVLGERVVSPQTADTMRRLMRLVVEEGTGKQAAVKGFLVGGKTGTAEKATAGGYARKALLSSFVAAFPMTDPRYLVIAILDEPKGTKATYNFATGGWTAAPVTGRVIARAGPLLGVMPVDEESGDVHKAMLISTRKGRSGAAF